MPDKKLDEKLYPLIEEYIDAKSEARFLGEIYGPGAGGKFEKTAIENAKKIEGLFGKPEGAEGLIMRCDEEIENQYAIFFETRHKSELKTIRENMVEKCLQARWANKRGKGDDELKAGEKVQEGKEHIFRCVKGDNLKYGILMEEVEYLANQKYPEFEKMKKREMIEDLEQKFSSKGKNDKNSRIDRSKKDKDREK